MLDRCRRWGHIIGVGTGGTSLGVDTGATLGVDTGDHGCRHWGTSLGGATLGVGTGGTSWV